MKLADVRLTARGDAVIATISGEVDMSNTPELRAALTEGTSNAAAGLVLDLSAVEYLDSAGVQLLFRLHDDLRIRAQRLTLVVPETSIVAATFRLAGITGKLNVASELEDAIASLAAEGAAS